METKEEPLEPAPDWTRVIFKSITQDGLIWVTTFPQPNMCFERSELKEPVGSIGKVEIGDVYAVKGELLDCWYRGKVEFITSDKVEVFLIDIGEQLWASLKNLLVLPDDLKRIEPQIYQIGFYGIQPLIGDIKITHQFQFTKVPSSRWNPAEINFISRKLKESTRIYFKNVTSEKFATDKKAHFGYIYVDCADKIACLNDILCFEEIATKLESSCGIAKQLKSFLPDSSNYQIKTFGKNEITSPNSFIDAYSKFKYVDKNLVPEKIKRTDESTDNKVENPKMDYSTSDSSEIYSPKKLVQSEKINARTQTSSHKVKRLKPNSQFCVLLHCSPDIEERIEPVNSLTEAFLCGRIQSVLVGKRRSDLTPVQKYIYPVLCKRYNMVVIGNSGCGKTLSSIVSVVSLLRQEDFYKSLKTDYGPRAIHVCSYSHNVRNTTQMYNAIVNGTDVVVKMVCGGAGVDSVKLDLPRGCDILVTTPPCLVRILKASNVTNLLRLCHIVYDDVHVLFEIFLKEIKLLTASLRDLEESRKSYKVQKIVLSTIWFPKLKDFVKTVITSGFICISNNNQLESAIYSNLKPRFTFLQPQHKLNFLIDLLKGDTTNERIVVICYNQEILELEKALDLPDKRIFFAHEGLEPVEVIYMRNSWMETKSNENPIILCTDLILYELEITDCTWLIHYSLPISKTDFRIRFGCLLDSYHNIFLKEETAKAKIHIFIDESNDEQFPEVVSLMKRLKINVDPKFEKIMKKINKHKELAKMHKPVCDQLREFGSCFKEKCLSRHMFIKSVDDVESEFVPKTGFIKFKVLHLHSVSHYSVQILEYKVGSVWTIMPNVRLLGVISLKMDSHYRQQSNIFTFPEPVLGDRVAVENDGAFCRAEVVDILEKKSPKQVVVKLLDIGKLMVVNALQLYELPEHLKEYEGQAIDVFLCNLKPSDQDCEWGVDAVQYVQRWLRDVHTAIRLKGKNHYLFGQINLRFGTTLWLDQVTYCQWLEETKSAVHTSLGHLLIQDKIVLRNRDHMKNIRQLCGLGKLQIVEEKKEEKKSEENTRGQWAHLPRDEFSAVEVILAESPDLIFVRLVKFKDRLDLLTKDFSETKISRLNQGDLSVGDFCLAFYDDDESWNRAKVMSFKSATEVKVFFVDHGDHKTLGWDQLAKISDMCITRLPFQAIECRLTGVRAPNEEWSKDIVEELYKLTEIEEMVCKTLQAHVFDLELKATVTGGRKYSVILIDTNQPEYIVINKELVKRGLSEWQLEDEGQFDNIVSRCYEIVSSADESEETFSADELEKSEFIDSNDKIDPNLNKNSNEVVALSPHQYSSDVRWDGEELVPVVESEAECGPLQEMLMAMLDDDNDDNDWFDFLGLDRNRVLEKLSPRELPSIENTSGVDGDISDHEDVYDNSRKDNDGDRPPPLVHIGSCYNPNVTWFDDIKHVWVYIHLTDVQKYKITWSYRSLSVRTIHNNKYYSADFSLFGVIQPTTLKHSALGFHILIKMEKMVFGELWPRLVIAEGPYNWIKRHADHIDAASDSDEESFSKGKIKQQLFFNREDVIIEPKPPGLDSDSEFSSDPGDAEWTGLIE